MKPRNQTMRIFVAIVMALGVLVLSGGLVSAQTNEPVAETTSEAVDQPTEQPVDTYVETPTETPAETPTESSTETPTETPTETSTETPTETPTEEPTELSRIFVYKLFCAEIDLEAEEPCVGRVPAAEGTTVDFELTSVDEGWTDLIPVEIVEFDGFTEGGVEIYDLPFGTYTVTEIVPDGYDAAAYDLTDGVTVDGVMATIELGAADEEVLFVNVPVDDGPPVTPPVSPPPVTPPVSPPPVTPPSDDVPKVTPDVETPVTVKPAPTQVAVTTLPDTGTGATGEGTIPVAGLTIAAALLLIGAVATRRLAIR